MAKNKYCDNLEYFQTIGELLSFWNCGLIGMN